jgi:6,7-dimethyl-8-ribityllumazine synthase
VTGSGSYHAQLEGRLDGRGLRIAVLAARFHAAITETLLERCLEGLRDHGVDDADVEVVRVPGAWELPQVAALLARRGGFDALVALGCVIRGETPHFDFVAGEAARGLGAVARAGACPVIFGVLTTDTEGQARERADPAGQDKGRELALAALEMARLFRDLEPA